MSAGQPQVPLGQGQFAEHLVGQQAIAAAVQQPAQLVAGDFGFARGNHSFDFFQIFGPLASAARMDQLPRLLAGDLAQRESRWHRESADSAAEAGRRPVGLRLRATMIRLPGTAMFGCELPLEATGGRAQRNGLKVTGAGLLRLSGGRR